MPFEFVGQRDDYPRIGINNVLTPASITSPGEVAGKPATNVTNPSLDEIWEFDLNDTVQYLEFDVPNDTYNYIGLAGYDADITDEGGLWCAVDVWNGASWGVLDATLVEGSGVFFWYFGNRTADRFRLRLNSSLTPRATNANFKCAVIYFGKILECPQKIYVGHAPANLNRSTRKKDNIAESGLFLGSVVEQTTIGSSVALSNIPQQTIRDDFAEFIENAADTPFFFAWRPETYDEEVYFGWATNDPDVSNQDSSGRMQLSFNFRAYLNDE